MHHAVPEQIAPGLNALHVTPSQIGDLAASAGVKALVLSHHMERALACVSESRAAITRRYTGPLSFAEDLECYCLD
jgi:ribonuclease BN (tRNA processing enzyme)